MNSRFLNKKFNTGILRLLVRLGRLFAAVALVLGSATVWGSLFPVPASAAGDELRIKNVKVSVWPEYDDPRTLVIYQGEFTDGGTFPREVKFRAPKDAAIQMVCALTPKDEHKCQYYDTTFDGDYKTLTFNLPIPTFYFEYYDPNLVSSATDKTISYQFVNPPYAIDAVNLEIQQPLKAANFAINPGSTAATADTQGFKYYDYQFNSVPADKALNFAISYSKTDPNPSVQKQTQQSGGAGQTNNAAIVLASVAGLVAVLVASYYVSTKHNKEKKYATRAASLVRVRQAERNATPAGQTYWPAAPEPKPTRAKAPGAIFCSNCGVRLEQEDAFCFSCGQSVKRHGNPATEKRR